MAKGDQLHRAGRAVAVRRGQLGMTQQELADAAGVDLKTIYNLESGTRWPIAKTRAAVAAALRWDTDALVSIATGNAPVAVPDPPRRDRELSVLADADEAGLRPYLDSVFADIAAAEAEYGPAFGASQAFPDPSEATIWHDPDNVLSRDERARFIARIRKTVADLDARQRRTGLAALPGRW